MTDELLRRIQQTYHEVMGTTPLPQRLAELLQEIQQELEQDEEYTDEQTGVRMTVEQDNPEYPGHPKITVICPEQRTLSLEQINGAVKRLRQRARLSSDLFPDLKVNV